MPVSTARGLLIAADAPGVGHTAVAAAFASSPGSGRIDRKPVAQHLVDGKFEVVDIDPRLFVIKGKGALQVPPQAHGLTSDHRADIGSQAWTVAQQLFDLTATPQNG
jgi:hypothetical protein